MLKIVLDLKRHEHLRHYVFAPEILEVYTNTPKLYDFKFGIPSACERQTLSAPAACRVTLEWREVDNVRAFIEGHRLVGEPASQKSPYIFRERPLPFGKRAQVLLRWGTGPGPTAQLLTNKEYFLWASLRLTSSSHYPLPGTILSNVACVALLEAGYTPVHCACVNLDGIGVLLVASSDTGKTSTTQKLVQSYGFRFVAEDIAITNGQEIVGCPYTGTGIPSKEPSYGFLKRFQRMVLYLYSKGGTLYSRESLSSILEPSSILPKTIIDYVIFLKKGKDRILNIDKQEATSLLLKSNRLEFPYLTDRFLLQLWYQYDVPNIQYVAEQEHRLLTALVYQSKATLSISAEDANGFASQIDYFLRSSRKR